MKIIIVSVLAVALLGCGKREPGILSYAHVGENIEQESLEQAFKAIDELANPFATRDKLTDYADI